MTGDLEQLGCSAERLSALGSTLPQGESEAYITVLGAWFDLWHHIFEAEQNGHARETILDVLKPARSLLARSVFLRRLQEWPRGYPGDFETVALSAGVGP